MKALGPCSLALLAAVLLLSPALPGFAVTSGDLVAFAQRSTLCFLAEGGAELGRQVGIAMWRHPERLWACLLLCSCLWSRLVFRSARGGRGKGQATGARRGAGVGGRSDDVLCLEDHQRGGASGAPRAIFHGLHRTFSELRALLPDLVATGFDAIQLPPAQASPVGNLRSQWYLRYQPLRYGVIDPQLGGESELRRLCTEADKLGIRIVADCVFNHCAVVATKSEWQAAQRDPRLMEELKRRLDRTFGPELTREDFQFPWVCLEGDKWDDPAYTYEGWGCGEWSELRFSERVLRVHFQHLSKLLKCGVRGFRIDAAKHMRPAHVRRYVEYLYEEGASFVYVEVLSLNTAVHAQYEALSLEHLKVHSTDFPFAAQVREAARCEGGGEALAKLAAASGLGADAVRFVRNHDTILNHGEPICGLDWHSSEDAKLAWAYVLARPEGSVLVYEDDAREPTVQRALAFRRLLPMQARSTMLAQNLSKLADSSQATVGGSELHSETRVWPPPTYDLVFLLVTSASYAPLGVAVLNFTTSRTDIQLPWDFVGSQVREVFAGLEEDGQPKLGEPLAETSMPTVDGRGARFFVVEPVASEYAVPESLSPGGRNRSLTLLYFTGWATPHMHFGLRGHWTPVPGWPFRQAAPPPGFQGTKSRGRWWSVEVPLAQGSGPVEFVLNDGAGCWDHAVGKRNYKVLGGGTYVLEGGLLRKLAA